MTTPDDGGERLRRLIGGEPLAHILGDEVARVAEEGGYRYSLLQEGLLWTPGARGIALDLDTELPVDDPDKARAPHRYDGLARTAHDGSLALPDPTWFLLHAATDPDRHGEYAAAYDELRLTFAPEGKVADFAGLYALREALIRQLKREEGAVQDVLRTCRSLFAVLYVEARHVIGQLPTAEQGGKLTLYRTIGAGWSRFIGGDSLAWMLQPDRGLQAWLSPFPVALIEYQAAALEPALAWRDRLIEDVLPFEYRRHACELILAKGMRGAPVEPWGEGDAGTVRQPERGGALSLILTNTPALLDYAWTLYDGKGMTLPDVWERIGELAAQEEVTLRIGGFESFHTSFYAQHRGKRKRGRRKGKGEDS